MDELTFSRAKTPDELQQVHRLNHAVFAEELGQHRANADGVLVDRFDSTNRYFIAKRRSEVVGMISINLAPPFSIEKRLPDRSVIETRFRDACEVRLLSIQPRERHAMVLAGLFWQVYDEALLHGRSHMLISGIEARRETYAALGFVDLGPGVEEGAASFIPMALDLKDIGLVRKARRFKRWWTRRCESERRDKERQSISLMPGPVEVSEGVREAFNQAAISHRGERVVEVYNEVRNGLRMLMGGMPVAVLTGSGTLANDAVAMCLKARFADTPGVVLANGEFGERLIRQAERAGLRFNAVRQRWGSAWDRAEIEGELERGATWVWGVHLETSTGQMNDVIWLSEVSARRGVAVAADCVSSLGAVAMDGLELAFATGVSGKSLGSYAGLAFVYVAGEMLEAIEWDRLPSSFDLAKNIAQRHPVFTLPSSQLLALGQAMEERFSSREAALRRYEEAVEFGAWVRRRLRECGFPALVEDSSAAPVIATIQMTAAEIERCRKAGFELAYQSCYLQERRWAQIATMGEVGRDMLEELFVVMRR